MDLFNRVDGRQVGFRYLVQSSILSVVAFLFMYIEIPLAFIAPPFMVLDFSDVPALIGSFAMGPLYGILIELNKNILHIFVKGTMTGGVGELSNFLLGATYVGLAGLIYKYKRTYKGAIMGLFVGGIGMSILGVVSNYFVIFPLYGKLMGLDMIIAMGTAVSDRIQDLFSFMVYSVLPFNLIKAFLTSLVTLLVYKKLSKHIK
ncbi:MAG: ECF transporter S component [Tissierellia bacterium]|nr:ECF transporter S component [Tissierellia bacterium]